MASDPSLAAKSRADDASLDAAILAGWDKALGGPKADTDPSAAVKETEERILGKASAPEPDEPAEDNVEVVAPRAASDEDDETNDADLDPALANAEEEEAKARAAAGQKAELAAKTEAKPDAGTLKRLEQIQKAEQRHKAAAAVRMQELQRKEAELSERAAAVQRFESLRERVRFDPVAVLMELGLTEDDFDAAGQQIYAYSKAGRENPKLRQSAAEMMQRREHETKTQKLERELQELRQERDREKQEIALERYKDGYLARAKQTTSDETPIMRAMMAEDPTEARELVYYVANELYQQTGEEPEPHEVINTLEQLQRAELKKRGINLDLLKKNPAPAPAGEKKTAAKKTLTNDMTNPKAPPKTTPRDDDELDRAIVRAIESGQFE